VDGVATEQELASVRERLFGLIPESRIIAVDIPRPAPGVLARFDAVTDLCSSISDALDELGLGGALAASTLVPRLPGARRIGPAITIRYRPEQGSVGALVGRGEPAKLADRDLYNIGRAGDVAVFDCGGFAGASVMGGLSAAWARRLDIAACVVDGAIRDIESIRGEGVPVWSRAVTPVSGKHRLQALELNCPVSVAGVPVEPGDLIAADETGVCVVPLHAVEEVLERCLAAEQSESSVVDAIRSGMPPEEVARILRPERW
jgi:4-hydroxy-4-methyl-2-oxoglutarate aldolase